jgi:hydroxyacylglutathione hydrolase
MLIRQMQLGPMANFVYLIGADSSDSVVVVDPAWDVPAIEAAAREAGRKIAGAIVSHCHLDHINGLPELLKRHDVPVYANQTEVDFSAELQRIAGAIKATAPGDVLNVAGMKMKMLHTPGHTPGSQCVLAEGAVFSGDTVFINACGRCDLKGGDPEAMFRSIQNVLTKLPDETKLFSGHNYAAVPDSTFGEQKRENPYFQFSDLQEFVRYRMRPRAST